MQSVAGVDLVSGALQSSLARAQKNFSNLNPNKKRLKQLRHKQKKLNRQFGNKKLLKFNLPVEEARGSQQSSSGSWDFSNNFQTDEIEFVSKGNEIAGFNQELRNKYYCLKSNSEFSSVDRQTIFNYYKTNASNLKGKIKKNSPVSPRVPKVKSPCKVVGDNTKFSPQVVVLPFNDNLDEGERPLSKQQRRKRRKAEKARLAQLALLQLQPKELKPEPNTPLKKKNKRIMKEILENNSSPTKSGQPSLPTPKIVLYAKEKIVPGWKQKGPVGCGLFNMGNTCYLNATLQALFHTPSFVNWLVSDEEHRQKCHGNFNSFDTCTICAMYAILKETHKTQGMALRPHQIFSKLKYICKHFNHGRQEDAHEFLRYLLESMERSYLNAINANRLDNRSKETTPLGQIFGGYMRTEVTCLNCSFVSTTFQPLAELQLEIKAFYTVDECIQHHFRKERLENNDYKCEKCLRTGEATKQFSLESPPVVLCLQLKRFTLHGTKLGRSIQCNKTLNLTRFLHKTQLQKAHSDATYHLVALINHIGSSPNCGHYTATAEASNGIFYHYDDSFVRNISSHQALSSDAYVIIYEMDKEKKGMNGNGTTSNYLNTQNQNNRLVFPPQKLGNSILSPKSAFAKSNNENEYNSFKSNNMDKKFTPPLFKSSNSALKNGFSRPPSTITSNSTSPSNSKISNGHSLFGSTEKIFPRTSLQNNSSLISPNSKLKSDEGSPIVRKSPFHQTYSNRNLVITKSQIDCRSKSPSLLSSSQTSLVPYVEDEEEEPKIQSSYHPNTPPRSPLKTFDGSFSKKRLFPDNQLVPEKEKKIPKMTFVPDEETKMAKEAIIDVGRENEVPNGSLSATSIWKVSKDNIGDNMQSFKEYSSDPETRKLNDNSDFSRLRKVKAKRAKSMEKLVGVDHSRDRDLPRLGKFSIDGDRKGKLTIEASSSHSVNFRGEIKLKNKKAKSKSKSPITPPRTIKGDKGGGIVNGAYIFSSPEEINAKLESPTKVHITNGHTSVKRSRSDTSQSSSQSSNTQSEFKKVKKKKKSEKRREEIEKRKEEENEKHKDGEKTKGGSEKHREREDDKYRDGIEKRGERDRNEKHREGREKERKEKKKKKSKKRDSSDSSRSSDEGSEKKKNGSKILETTKKFVINLFNGKKKQHDPDTTQTDLSDNDHSQKSNSQSSRTSSINKLESSGESKFDPEQLKSPKVMSWNGDRGNLSMAMHSDKKRLLEKSKEDLYNEELDEGKTKKKSQSNSDSYESDVSNKFQKYEDNRRKVKKWESSNEIQVYEGYTPYMGKRPPSSSNEGYRDSYNRDQYRKPNGHNFKGHRRNSRSSDGRNHHRNSNRYHGKGFEGIGYVKGRPWGNRK